MPPRTRSEESGVYDDAENRQGQNIKKGKKSQRTQTGVAAQVRVLEARGGTTAIVTRTLVAVRSLIATRIRLHGIIATDFLVHLDLFTAGDSTVLLPNLLLNQ